MSDRSITVVLADDQPLVREGLRRVVARADGIEVVADVGDGRRAIEAAIEHRPDVTVMDIRMPVLDGLAATAEIVTAVPGTRVLVLTTFDLDEYVFRALRAGASGFVLKDAPLDDLVDAIRIVAAGEALLAPRVTRRVIERFAARSPSLGGESDPLPSLTGRERDVLNLVVRGHTNAEIARELFITEATVKTHVRSMLLKLNLRDRTQLVIAAYESGFTWPGL